MKPHLALGAVSQIRPTIPPILSAFCNNVQKAKQKRESAIRHVKVGTYILYRRQLDLLHTQTKPNESYRIKSNQMELNRGFNSFAFHYHVKLYRLSSQSSGDDNNHDDDDNSTQKLLFGQS